MMYEATGRLLVTPVDREAQARVRRLRELDLGERPEPALDAFADRLARVMDAPYSMVNFVGEEHQFFAGLHAPEGVAAVADEEYEEGAAPGEGADAPVGGAHGRYRARDHGYCPHVMARGKALVLEDVSDYPRFAGNPVVDELGVRSYLGAPLIDRTGVALGTVCVEDVEPRPWGRSGLDTIKSMAAELTERIRRREADGELGVSW
ncbi:GAF domain-containing protein [Streptomyces sp. PmtG]